LRELNLYDRNNNVIYRWYNVIYLFVDSRDNRPRHRQELNDKVEISQLECLFLISRRFRGGEKEIPFANQRSV